MAVVSRFLGPPCRFPCLDLLKPRLESSFHALLAGEVVLPTFQAVRQAFHGGDVALEIMGVHVALAVIQVFHEARGRVADVKGHRLGQLFDGILFRGSKGLRVHDDIPPAYSHHDSLRYHFR